MLRTVLVDAAAADDDAEVYMNTECVSRTGQDVNSICVLNNCLEWDK